MTEAVKGHSEQDVQQLFEGFHNLVTSDPTSEPETDHLGKLAEPPRRGTETVERGGCGVDQLVDQTVRAGAAADVHEGGLVPILARILAGAFRVAGRIE